MSYTVEKDWITKAGLRAVVIIAEFTKGVPHHRCGYVEVPKGHPFHGVGYSEQIPQITAEAASSTTLGKKGALLAFTAGVGADTDDSVRRSLDIAIDVHGGITFADGGGKYPVESDGWWFGFDCAHAGDGEITPSGSPFRNNDPVRELPYVEAECESMATQIEQLARVTS